MNEFDWIRSLSNSPGKRTALSVRSLVLHSSLALARPYPLIPTSKRTRRWLCSIFPVFFFYNLLYCYLYCIVLCIIVFISKGKFWSFPWMFFLSLQFFDVVIRSISRKVCLHFWSLCVLICVSFLLSIKLAGYMLLSAGNVLLWCLFLFPFTTFLFFCSPLSLVVCFIIEVLSMLMSMSMFLPCHRCLTMSYISELHVSSK